MEKQRSRGKLELGRSREGGVRLSPSHSPVSSTPSSPRHIPIHVPAVGERPKWSLDGVNTVRACAEIQSLLHCIRTLFPRVSNIFQTIDPFTALLPLLPILAPLDLSIASSFETLQLLFLVICQLSLEELEEANRSSSAVHLSWLLYLFTDPPEYMRHPQIKSALIQVLVDLMSHIHSLGKATQGAKLSVFRSTFTDPKSLESGTLHSKLLRQTVTSLVQYLTISHVRPLRLCVVLRVDPDTRSRCQCVNQRGGAWVDCCAMCLVFTPFSCATSRPPPSLRFSRRLV